MHLSASQSQLFVSGSPITGARCSLRKTGPEGGGVVGGVSIIKLGGVNCYLVTTGDGFILIDNGTPEKRDTLEAEITAAGCTPENLRLLVLTHGDYDHAGNAAYLSDHYGCEIAMHRDDAERVRTADWSCGMKPKPDKFGLAYRVVSRFIKPGPFDTFEPSIYVEDGQPLAGYGLDATVLHLPGHTRGSIGVLTGDGDLFCGDLMDGMGKPSLQFFIDDMPAAQASLARLRGLVVHTVYPGHGKPFPLERVANGG
jgi:glyoxylase-like metal-dependent hydrolase (beta-lactamase superfamily II)